MQKSDIFKIPDIANNTCSIDIVLIL